MVEDRKWELLVRLFFVVIVITSISDIVADIGQGAKVLHILQESAVCLFALSLLLILFFNTRAQTRRNAQLSQELGEARAYSARASRELVDAKRVFGEEISKQFASWQLTESESDIALFTLKGFSAKEIANLRSVSEKTVRNQLTSVYRKSGATGKLGFIAWFMEGLL